MKKASISFAMLPLLAAVLPAQRPWQQLTVPSVREAAANFKAPPHEYGAIQPFLSWNGGDAKSRMARIVQDLDRLSANGIFVINVSPGAGVPLYLTPEHMDQMKFVVQEAGKRGMKIWLQDESDYPSGFAGGKISQQYPQLGMQGIVADIQVRAQAGQTLTMPVPSDTLGIVALETGYQDHQLRGVIPIPLPSNGQLKWTVPKEGTTPNEPMLAWDVVFVRHVYVSAPTRNFNREDGTRAKDGFYSLIDYLDVEATRAFLKITHETYRQAIGGEFGKTVLGFFGDEPDFGWYIAGAPWTPKLLEEFQSRKGYDLRPYIPMFFAGKWIQPAGHIAPRAIPALPTPEMTDEVQRAKADYWDVWTGMIKDTFFGEQADWCARYNLEYLVHLAQEQDLSDSYSRQGDYFRNMRKVGVPGIDNLNQLLPGTVHTPDGTWHINNNFPKLASSAAHLFGRPKVWSEDGGELGVDGKYQLDYQLVRGINAMQLRVPVRAGSGGGDAAVPPQAPMLAWYTNRAGYLAAIGRPAAQVGLYHPTNSMWMGDEEADPSATKLGWQLLERQVDWDYFDEQSLSSVATIADGGFKNLSGQVYRAIVVPSTTVITRTGLERFQAFVKAGGKLIFVGKTPTLVVDKTFLNAPRDAKPDLSFATLIEPSGDITPRVMAALPKPDVKLDAEFQRLTYMHRGWRDAEMYFFFNESDKAESRTATVAGRGQAQVWDLSTGEIHAMAAAVAENDSVRFPLVLGPYEAKLVVVGPLPSGVATPEPSLASGSTLAELGGDWILDLNGKRMTTPLKSWEDLGTTSFSGPATYRKQFTATAPAGKRVFLEIADVRDYAKIKLNGKDFEGHAWQPYRWDITSALKTGSNDLEIQVNAAPAGRAGPAGRGPAVVYGASGGGGRRPGGTPPVSGLLGPVRLVAR